MCNDYRDALSESIGEAKARRVVEDARWLERALDPEVIRREFIEPILGGDAGASSELFVSARLSTTATSLELHPQGHGTRRCDVRALFGGTWVPVEVKKQRDTFPFNNPGEEVEPGVTLHGGSRPGADPRFLGEPPADTTDPLPGAAIWRDALEEAAGQLPRGQPGIIAIECDAMGHLDIDTSDALFGDVVVVAHPHQRGWGSNLETRRLGNGFFHDERFRHVAGVWFYRLVTDESGVQRTDWARGYKNPNYTGPDLPEEVAYSLFNVVDAPPPAAEQASHSTSRIGSASITSC